MQLNRKNYTYLSVLVLAVAGTTGASMQLSQPARAGESVRECIQALIDDGISETNAAIACRGQRNSNWDNYKNGSTYLELRARSGPTPEGRWRYSAPGVPYDVMQRAGCQNVSGDDWRCPTRKLRVYVHNHQPQYLELRARSGPTPEGRWRYSAPGIPYDVMQRAGCQNISGDDWRCPTRKLRVYIHNNLGSSIQFPQPPENPAIFPF
ncbi:hypothetical protein H6G76_31720 [Nostoc sp. FACHB-152]|uniref:hypothetical protein n=1 Tax=unclassified Nostoc TaxID=2593658 RepID=UPI00168557E5|nr:MULTISPECIES: hypothetical protein [unclassified Nostoc]MBD2451608.1 hypothetical protein [Nostoc sp. FACHB-152]MBD2472709.1 hypothetical protein [Nostoc sp. FACHB-145]